MMDIDSGLEAAAARWPQRPPHITPLSWYARHTSADYYRQDTGDVRAALEWFTVDRDLCDGWQETGPRGIARVLADAARVAHAAGVHDPRHTIPAAVRTADPDHRVDAATAAHLLYTVRTDPRSVHVTCIQWAVALEDRPDRARWLAGLLYLSAHATTGR